MLTLAGNVYADHVSLPCQQADVLISTTNENSQWHHSLLRHFTQNHECQPYSALREKTEDPQSQ